MEDERALENYIEYLKIVMQEPDSKITQNDIFDLEIKKMIQNKKLKILDLCWE